MQEYLNGPDKNESKDAKRPGQDKGVRTDVRRERVSRYVEPEACNREDRNDVYDDDPCGKAALLNHAAPAGLDYENEGKNRRGNRAGQGPNDRDRDMKNI